MRVRVPEIRMFHSLKGFSTRTMSRLSEDDGYCNVLSYLE